MATTCVELLALAGGLVRSEQEVLRRNGVGRAYYAAFHVSKDWHCQLPGGPGSVGTGRGGGMHMELINQLGNPSPSNPAELRLMSKQVSAMLRMVKSLRTVADYKLDLDFDSQDASTAFENSRLLYEALAESMSSGLNPVAITSQPR